MVAAASEPENPMRIRSLCNVIENHIKRLVLRESKRPRMNHNQKPSIVSGIFLH